MVIFKKKREKEMEFYKLFRIVHRRTDWIELWTFERKTVMPERYEEKEEIVQEAIQDLYSKVLGICRSFIK